MSNITPLPLVAASQFDVVHEPRLAHVAPRLGRGVGELHGTAQSARVQPVRGPQRLQDEAGHGADALPVESRQAPDVATAPARSCRGQDKVGRKRESFYDRLFSCACLSFVSAISSASFCFEQPIIFHIILCLLFLFSKFMAFTKIST